MQARKTFIGNMIATDVVFIIPVYQRNYSWQKVQCEQLFSDIERIIKTNNNHFIGTICYKSEPGNNKNSILIDGQQRLTSIMLFLKALYDFSENNFIKETIKEKFLINKWREHEEFKMKLKPIKFDEFIYKKLIESDNIEEDFLETEKNNNVFRNYNYFKEFIKASEFDDKSFLNAVDKLEVVELELENENPQEIFESLNSTGLDLNNVDKLRNFLLMSIDYNSQKQFYEKYWIKIEELIDEDNIEPFMINYLILKNKSVYASGIKNNKISTKNLYASFKFYFKEHGIRQDIISVENFLIDMYKHAKYYAMLLSKDNKYSNDKIKQKIYELFINLNCINASIPIMYLYDKYCEKILNNENFEKILDIFISYNIRAWIVTGKSGTSTIFAARLKDISEFDLSNASCINQIWESFNQDEKSGFKKDNEFKNALINNELYKTHVSNTFCKYILSKIENYQRKTDNKKEMANIEEAQIEHIMPQKLSTDWKEYLNKYRDYQNHKIYLNTIGNLTLTKYNQEMSNKIFSIKKGNYYYDSGYILTKQVSSKNNIWTSEQIVRRSNELAEIALKIWSLPAKFNKNVVIEENVSYNLKCGFGNFAKTKPNNFSICEETISVSNWSDLISKLFLKIYELDKNVFLELIGTKNNLGKVELITTNPDKTMMDRYTKVVDYIYVYTNSDTEDKLKLIDYVLKYIDDIEGTNLRDEFEFTLKL